MDGSVTWVNVQSVKLRHVNKKVPGIIYIVTVLPDPEPGAAFPSRGSECRAKPGGDRLGSTRIRRMSPCACWVIGWVAMIHYHRKDPDVQSCHQHVPAAPNSS